MVSADHCSFRGWGWSECVSQPCSGLVWWVSCHSVTQNPKLVLVVSWHWARNMSYRLPLKILHSEFQLNRSAAESHTTADLPKRKVSLTLSYPPSKLLQLDIRVGDLGECSECRRYRYALISSPNLHDFLMYCESGKFEFWFQRIHQ